MPLKFDNTVIERKPLINDVIFSPVTTQQAIIFFIPSGRVSHYQSTGVFIMVNGFDEFAQERLKQAESAEKEVQRLEGLAAEAPQLRLAKAKAERAEERQRNKDGAMSKALDATLIAAEKQERVPAMLGEATRAVVALYTQFKEVDSARRQAMEALAIADRVDYDVELEENEERERSLDRDTRGLAYALAARHGDIKVKAMLDELDPEFALLRGCDLDEPINRDVANFVISHAVPTETQSATLISPSPATETEAAVIEPPVGFEPATEVEAEVTGGPDD